MTTTFTVTQLPAFLLAKTPENVAINIQATADGRLLTSATQATDDKNYSYLFTYNVDNTIATESRTYNGNTEVRTYTYDGSGNLITDSGWPAPAPAPAPGPAPSGTVKNTAGDLTSNAIVLGAGTIESKVTAGITTDGTRKVILGLSNSLAGVLDFKNATNTGTTSLLSTAGSSGNFTITLPPANTILVGKDTTDVLTNKTLTAPIITNPAVTNPTGLVKTDVGLGNVDNVSDVNKPISNATKTALNTKSTVVSSIAGLKALLKTEAPRVFTTGYYTNGDGGSGVYYYDASDTTSADNSGTIIVATDGGRWKLVHEGEVSIAQFGAVGDGSVGTVAMYAAISNAWSAALLQKFNLYGPPGTYDVGDNNFPFRQATSNPPSLLDCGGIVFRASGPNCILKTTSASGADVLQLNGLDNFQVRGFPTLTSVVTGALSGSNGCSITGGWDRMYLEIAPKNCASLDKGSILDGGKGLTIQPSASTPVWGRLEATVLADGCVEGFGFEPDLVAALTRNLDITVNVTARNCYMGVKCVALGASSALPVNMSMGTRINLRAIDCQRDVVIQRMHGLWIDYQTVSTKTAAAKRLNFASTTWFASDTIVDSLLCNYAKNATIKGNGNKGACDYKAQIGGASAGSSGLNGATQYCNIDLDIGGTAATANLNSLNSGGNSVKDCALIFSPVTTSSIPSDFTQAANANRVRIGTKLTGSFTATLTGCTTAPTISVAYSVEGDRVTLNIPQVSATSNSTGCTLTGMPDSLYPLNAQFPFALVQDAGAVFAGRIAIDTAGLMNLNKLSSSVFTNTGTKGVESCTITYART